MERKITYNKETDSFEIHMVIPRTMRGENTYGDGEWKQDGVCVWINERYEEYALSHTQYLDYKNSLQATQPIIYFENKEEALKFAAEHNLMVEYAS